MKKEHPRADYAKLCIRRTIKSSLEGANIRKGYWRCARNPIITKAISAEKLKKAGYFNFLQYYESVRT
ncbi:hypothetical protein [Desulfotruncus arcticus]|uniref:hypothetical protein n=1 Tax=Desulfotruncus arcticus TaxID=341036 RepID=UPI000B817D0F|nr:hypothetical protein [Desulfotruncus arcticus]